MPRVTLQDVAKKAGVSFKTVSRVLNNEPNVAPDTTRKVQKAIADLNYVPNSAARSLSSGKAMAIALVVGWPVTSPYSSHLIECALAESTQRGYNLALFSMGHGISHKILDAYRGRQVDGVILDTNAARDENLMAQIVALKVPHIVIHPNEKYAPRKSSYLQIDNTAGAREAARHLAECGHRQIGSIAFPSGLRQEDDRQTGYRTALEEAGIEYNLDRVYCGWGLPFQVGFDGATELITRYPDITALLVTTDETAMGAVSAIWSLGLRIPDDISVVGFDDISYASMISPPLTTIHQPIDEIARIAVEHVIACIDDPSTPPIDLVLPTKLVVRGSSRKLNGVASRIEIHS